MTEQTLNQTEAVTATAVATPVATTTVDNTPQTNGDELVFTDSSEFATKNTRGSYTQEQVELFVAEDGGASMSRLMPLKRGEKPTSKRIRSFPSPYAIIENDLDLAMYKVTSELIEDNAEYIITELPESPQINTTYFNEPVRVIKQNLISRVGRVPSNINNQKDKSKDIGIFINNLTSLANVALEQRLANIKVNLALSVPPKERYADTEKLNMLREKLAGIYMVELPRYGFTVRIEISNNPKDLLIEAEGELPYVYYVTSAPPSENLREQLRDQYVTVQDLGDSTFNQSLVYNGTIQSGFTSTSKYGGSNLISKLYKILSRSVDFPVTIEQARHGVEHGYIQSGPRKVAIGIQLTQAKTEVADYLYNEHVLFLQDAAIHANAIHSNLFVGRGFLETGSIVNGEPDDEYSPSIAHILSERYALLSPDTKAVIVKNPGLANLLGLTSLIRYEWSL